MATRENQGLQAIIIVLTILTIGLLVGLLLVNNARKTAVSRATSEEQKNTEATRAAGEAQGEANVFKTMMGFQESDGLEAIQTAFKAAMDGQGNIPEESKNYGAVVALITEENRTLTKNAANAADEVKKLKETLLAVQAKKEAEVKEFQQQMDKARADLAEARTQYDADRARMTTENESYQQKLAELNTQHDEAMAALETEKTDLETQIVKLERSVEELRLGLPEVDQFAQPADGRITGINQAQGTVWIDLGDADGLRPQVTFSIADQGLDDAAASEKKGSIEVVRILGPHMAEAKVTSDEATNPLLPGDRIYSQVWDRGRQVGFGIAGFIDLNDDGKDDLDKLKSIIAASGGAVDASPDATGAKQGNMKVSTRYLIQGEFPNDTRRGAWRDSWKNLDEEAEQLGIEKIALDEFLSLMGWQSEARSVPMDANARAEDFPPTALGQELPRKTGQPGGVFKKRLPNVTY